MVIRDEITKINKLINFDLNFMFFLVRVHIIILIYFKKMINIFIGYDSRESIASDVCELSIKRRTKSKTKIQLLKLEKLKKKKSIQELKIS